MKNLIIGDIHGRYKGVSALLEKATDYENDDMRLIFTGDYIDYFPHTNHSSKNTLELMLAIKEVHSCEFLLGNHDLWMLEWIEQGNVVPIPFWWGQGGRETLESYEITEPLVYNAVKSLMPKEHAEFLQSLKPYYYNNGIVVLHGGFDRKSDMVKAKLNAPLEDFGHYDVPSFRVWNILWDRDFWRVDSPKLLNEYKEIFGDRLFICGHTPYGVEYNEYLVKRLLIDGNAKDGKSVSSALVSGNEIEVIITENAIYKPEELFKQKQYI